MSLLLLMGDSAPSIGSLFSSGEAGLALDVETAYRRGWVYQDSAGATVSAAAGDPVGLILDTAKGGLDSLGSDLVSNGTFATDTVWSKGANWTIGSGVATKTGGAANNLTQTITSTAGLWYRITMDVTRTAGELTVSLGTSGTTRVINASGSYTFFILAGSSTQTLTLAGDSAFAGTVDNVTARLVPGNHAYQSTSGSRPALARTPDGGRRNVLTYSEQFDNAAWTKAAASISQNSTTAPDGTTTGDTLTEDSSAARHWVTTSSAAVANQVATFSIYVKKKDRRYCFITLNNSAGTSRYSPIFDLDNGTVVAENVTGSPTSNSASITSTGSGWYRLRATLSAGASGLTEIAFGLSDSATPSLLVSSPTYTGDGTSGVFIWGAQLEVGSSATAYQKVGLTSDVTESGKRDCWGLLFDGSDDSLITASVDFSATDKMTVMAGVRKLSDAVAGTLLEHTANYNTNNGTFFMSAPNNSGVNNYALGSKGTVSQANAVTTYAAPITNVLTGIGDISGDISRFRINSVQVVNDTDDQGSGNYANAVFYIGTRGGTTNYFNGILYTLIVRGAATPTGTIADFEKNLLRIRAGLGPF